MSVKVRLDLLGFPPYSSLSNDETPRTDSMSSRRSGTLCLSFSVPSANKDTNKSRQIQRRIRWMFCGPTTEKRLTTFPSLLFKTKSTGRFKTEHLHLKGIGKKKTNSIRYATHCPRIDTSASWTNASPINRRHVWARRKLTWFSYTTLQMSFNQLTRLWMISARSSSLLLRSLMKDIFASRVSSLSKWVICFRLTLRSSFGASVYFFWSRVAAVRTGKLD